MSYQLHGESPCDCCDGAEMGFCRYKISWADGAVDVVTVGRNCAQWFSDQLSAQIAGGRQLLYATGYEFEGPWANLQVSW